MPHRYLPAAGLALATLLPRSAAAQTLEPLPLRQPQLLVALPDSLVQLTKAPVLNLLVCGVPGIYITTLPAQNIFFPLTTIQPLLSRAAGVQVTPTSGAPGDWATVRIRGSGLRGSDQPLYVIDGLPALNADYVPGELPQPVYGWGTGPQAVATAPNPLLFVAPADVSSVEMLKGSSATLRYGSQAANGVIVITTRRGGLQGGVQAPRLRYEAAAAVQQLRRPVALLAARQYADLAGEVWRNDGSRGPAPFSAADLAALGQGTDWQTQVLRPAGLQSHYLSLDGSSARTRYLASANFLGQGGVVLGSQLRRYGLRLLAEHQFTPRLSGQLSASGAVVTRTLPTAATVPQALLAPPTVPATTANGEPTVTSGGQSTLPGYYAPFFNPLALARAAPATDATRRLLLRAGLRYEFNPRWQLTADLSHEQATTEASTQDLRADFTTPARPPMPYQASAATLHLATTNARLTATYRLPTLGRHALDADAGLLLQRTTRDQTLTIFAPPGVPAPLVPTTAGELATLGSAQAGGTYTYDQRLYLTARLRADVGAASAYGAGLGGQAQLYPGASGRWDISREKFWPGRRAVLSGLRLYAALGQVSSASLLAGNVPYNLAEQSGRPFFVSAQAPPLPRTTQLEAWLRLDLWNGRLVVQPDYYRHYTTHAGVAQLLPTSFTQDQLLRRDVDLLNQGLELSVTYVVYRGEKLYSNLSLAAAHNWQAVAAIAGSLPVPGLAVGEAAHPYFGYQRQGLDASGQPRYADQNGDGQVNALDTGYFGRGLPGWLLNLSHELTLGRFELQTQFDALLGYQLLSPVLAVLDQPTAATNASQRVLGRYAGPGSSADVPRASFYNQPLYYDTQSPEPASHLRLTQLTLGYRLPLPAPRQLRVWVGGQNLLVLSGYRGYDPNVSAGGSQGQLAGYDDSRYPVARVWQAGVQAAF